MTISYKVIKDGFKKLFCKQFSIPVLKPVSNLSCFIDFRDKRFYTKLSYTTKYDWPIRELLDEAEDYIANDAKTAIQKINKILEQYPGNLCHHLS